MLPVKGRGSSGWTPSLFTIVLVTALVFIAGLLVGSSMATVGTDTAMSRGLLAAHDTAAGVVMAVSLKPPGAPTLATVEYRGWGINGSRESMVPENASRDQCFQRIPAGILIGMRDLSMPLRIRPMFRLHTYKLSAWIHLIPMKLISARPRHCPRLHRRPTRWQFDGDCTCRDRYRCVTRTAGCA